MGTQPTAVTILRRAAVLPVLALLLQGCAAIPLDRFWPLPGGDPSDITRADPPAIRLAVKLPLPARPEPEGVTLVVALAGFDRDAAANRLAMTLVNEGRTVRADELPSAGPGYRWYLFKLTPAAERELGTLQSRVSGRGEPEHERAEFSAELAYENVSPGQTVNRSILLQLARGEDFFTLADGDHTVGNHATETRS